MPNEFRIQTQKAHRENSSSVAIVFGFKTRCSSLTWRSLESEHIVALRSSRFLSVSFFGALFSSLLLSLLFVFSSAFFLSASHLKASYESRVMKIPLRRTSASFMKHLFFGSRAREVAG